MEYSNIDMRETFKEFCDKTPELIESIKEINAKLPPMFDIFKSINRSNDEVKNSMVLADLFRVKFLTDNGVVISFVKLFIEYLNSKYDWKIIQSKHIKIATEVSTDEYRRIDLLITQGKNFAIIIENKIWARDQNNQINDYYEDIKSNKYNKIYVLYLTPSGKEPAEFSLSEKSREELGDRFKTLSHGDIAIWLENILKENDFIQTDNRCKYLYSAIIQIILNQKRLSGILEVNNMEKQEVINVMEKSKIELGIKNVKQYRDVFADASNICDEKYKELKIKFFKNVLTDLKQQSEKIGIKLEDGKGWEQNIKNNMPSFRLCTIKNDNICDIFINPGDMPALMLYFYYDGEMEKYWKKFNEKFGSPYDDKNGDYYYLCKDINLTTDEAKSVADDTIKFYYELKELLENLK